MNSSFLHLPAEAKWLGIHLCFFSLTPNIHIHIQHPNSHPGKISLLNIKNTPFKCHCTNSAHHLSPELLLKPHNVFSYLFCNPSSITLLKFFFSEKQTWCVALQGLPVAFWAALVLFLGGIRGQDSGWLKSRDSLLASRTKTILSSTSSCLPLPKNLPWAWHEQAQGNSHSWTDRVRYSFLRRVFIAWGRTDLHLLVFTSLCNPLLFGRPGLTDFQGIGCKKEMRYNFQIGLEACCGSVLGVPSHMLLDYSWGNQLPCLRQPVERPREGAWSRPFLSCVWEDSSPDQHLGCSLVRALEPERPSSATPGQPTATMSCV